VNRPARPHDVPVLIVGAGPTGLTLALWLTALGVRVRVIDKAAEPGTTSRAMAVQARTLEFDRQLGIADRVVDGGLRVGAVNLWGRGARAARLPIGRVGEGKSPFPFVLMFPQDAHERLLIARLAELGVGVERPTELAAFDQHPGGVRATLRRADGTVEVCEAAYLAGCDGAHSAVRRGLGVGFPGGTYEGLFYVADVEAGGPAADHEIHVDVEEGDFVGVFPYRGEGRLRLIGTVRPAPGRDPDQLTFDDVRGRAVENMKLAVTRVNWFSTYRVHHRVANQFRGGRAFLLGDAAHIHSPAGGQGMNTGIGDAVNLAWKLAAALSGAPDALLDTYEAERIGFARRLVATTDRVFTVVTRPGRAAAFVRLRVFARVAPWLIRFARVRRFAFRTVSQTGITYRGSPLSAGVAGAVRGGDRLPWVPLATGDNFDALQPPHWQVHVYGEVSPLLTAGCDELGLPLRVYPWSRAARQAGLRRGAVYLVRPDGHVALAQSHPDPAGLRRYFARTGIPRPAATSGGTATRPHASGR
jgi:2-polyprenyl-6-methoxyphenol hydroxylase-like FAD-dependent oxidoreductase